MILQDGRFRPTRYWSLTEKTNSHFADRHDELTVQLIDSVIAVFGDDGLDKLISNREESSMRAYRLALADRYGAQEKHIVEGARRCAYKVMPL